MSEKLQHPQPRSIQIGAMARLFAGLNGVVVKSHGSASERGFAHAISQGREHTASQLIMASTQIPARIIILRICESANRTFKNRW